MARASLAMSRRLRQHFHAEGLGVTSQQWQLLVQLWAQNGRTQQDLANILCKDKTSITRLVDNLEKSGIVERREDAHDRRSNLIFLTPRGEEILQPCFAQAQKTISEGTDGITAQELETCKRVLNTIFTNLNSEENILCPHSSDETETQHLCGLED